MYKKGKWYDVVPPDNWFLLTPSFWAFLAGTLVGVAANLLTGILLRDGDIGFSGLYIATALFFFSAAAFATVSIVVENCKARETKNLTIEIHERKLSLSLSFLLGLGSLMVGIVFICR